MDQGAVHNSWQLFFTTCSADSIEKTPTGKDPVILVSFGFR